MITMGYTYVCMYVCRGNPGHESKQKFKIKQTLNYGLVSGAPCSSYVICDLRKLHLLFFNFWFVEKTFI